MLQVEKPMSPWIKYMYMKRKKERERKEGRKGREEDKTMISA